MHTVGNGWDVGGLALLYSGGAYLLLDTSGSKRHSVALKRLEEKVDRSGPEILHVLPPAFTECFWFKVGHAFFTGVFFTACPITPLLRWARARGCRLRWEEDFEDRPEIGARRDSTGNSPPRDCRRDTLALEYRDLQALGY